MLLWERKKNAAQMRKSTLPEFFHIRDMFEILKTNKGDFVFV